MSERRFINIIRRMMAGEDFYTNASPRINVAEIREIEQRLGVLLQREHIHGVEPGPVAVYPLNKVEFQVAARHYILEAK